MAETRTPKRELLFSITAADCRWDYSRGTGKGGQKRNKTETHVRCTHIESGAVGQSDDTRSQHQNKRIAFRRMAESREFKAWHRQEVARRTGRLHEVSEWVDRELMVHTRVDVIQAGRWVPEANV